MTVFCCAKCGAELTSALRALAAVPDGHVKERDRGRESRLAPSAVPRGRYAIDPHPWGAPFVAPDTHALEAGGSRALLMPPDLTGMVSAGPTKSVIVHPEDVPSLQLIGSLGIHQGCCGPLGTGGRNLFCPCGTLVGTLAADCMGPLELHLDPLRTFALTAGGSS